MNCHEEYLKKIQSHARRDGYKMVVMIAETPDGYAVVHQPQSIIGTKELAHDLATWLLMTIGPDQKQLAHTLADALPDAIEEMADAANRLLEELGDQLNHAASADLVRELNRRKTCKPRQGATE